MDAAPTPSANCCFGVSLLITTMQSVSSDVWVALRALRLKLPEIAKPATGNLRGHIVGGAPAGGQRAGIRPHGVTRTGTLIGRANLGKREEKNTSSRTF